METREIESAKIKKYRPGAKAGCPAIRRALREGGIILIEPEQGDWRIQEILVRPGHYLAKMATGLWEEVAEDFPGPKVDEEGGSDGS